MAWKLKNVPADLRPMADALKISETAARVLVNRGIRSQEAALRYMNPRLEDLGDPSLMKDMDRAVELVSACAAADGRICVYGDYDADGVMSSTILWKTLNHFGVDAYVYIPDREEEGYGLNLDAVWKIKEVETDLIITCDNGIAALAEALVAKELGMQVVVLDHHEPPFVADDAGNRAESLPMADALVDPKQADCPYPFKQLCAGGLAYQFARAFYRLRGEPFTEGDEFLVLAALATICDIVDLQEENRIIAKNGLAVLNRNKAINPGLFELICRRGCDKKPIDTFTVGFVLGPCINASGRLDSAGLAVELLTTDERERMSYLAGKLVDLNEERKEMTKKAVDRALENIAGRELEKVLVVYDETVHESIAGIVAGRIKETVYRPTIVLTQGADCVKGSARSIEGYNIFEALTQNRELFERFGGHAMAAGMSLKLENVDILRERLNEQCALAEKDFERTITLDAAVQPEDATYKLAEELAGFEPFGKANHAPVFGAKGLVVPELRFMAEKNTMILGFSAGGYRTVKAVAFGLCGKFEEEIGAIYSEYECEKIRAGILRNMNLAMDIVYSLEINEYNGAVSVQLRIQDFRLNRSTN